MSAKNMPNFKSEAEERAFWVSHDSTEYVNWDEAETIVTEDKIISTNNLLTRIKKFDTENALIHHQTNNRN